MASLTLRLTWYVTFQHWKDEFNQYEKKLQSNVNFNVKIINYWQFFQEIKKDLLIMLPLKRNAYLCFVTIILII